MLSFRFIALFFGHATGFWADLSLCLSAEDSYRISKCNVGEGRGDSRAHKKLSTILF